MHTIPQQQLDFLSQSAPFDALPEEEIHGLAQDLVLFYLTNENASEILEEYPRTLFFIHSGQFSVKDGDGPQKHLSEGDFFNQRNLVNQLQSPIQIDVDVAGIVYCIEEPMFKGLSERYPPFARFFDSYQSEDLQTEAVNDSNSMWLYRNIGDILEREPVCADQQTPILQAVQTMTEHRVSSLLITHQNALSGILTDRDIRNRVVSAGADVNLPVEDIMTPEPVMIDQRRTLFDALCRMTERGIHHLPVVDKLSGKPLGMLTASDMIRFQRSNVLFLIDTLAKADSLYELTRLSWQMPHYFAQHAKRLGDFDIAGKVLSQATDIMTRKLITFYQQQYGEPPFDYCWLVYGSQAREDQTMGSDQDNGLLLAREPDALEAEYFESMGEYVCKGLNKCGIKLCNGNIMASNPALRLSLDNAVREAESWANAPTSKAIMHFNIFLDVRPVAGNTDLFAALQQARLPILQQKMMLAALARHANEVAVPLSMFQKFVYDKKAPHKDCIDLKTHAVATVNNIVRIYALAKGITAPSTLDRLEQLKSGSDMSVKDVGNLREIWLFLNRLRWRHQLGQKVTDNYVEVKRLSSIEKHQLKAAFQAIKRAQQAVIMRYSGGVSG